VDHLSAPEHLLCPGTDPFPIRDGRKRFGKGPLRTGKDPFPAGGDPLCVGGDLLCAGEDRFRTEWILSGPERVFSARETILSGQERVFSAAEEIVSSRSRPFPGQNRPSPARRRSSLAQGESSLRWRGSLPIRVKSSPGQRGPVGIIHWYSGLNEAIRRSTGFEPPEERRGAGNSSCRRARFAKAS